MIILSFVMHSSNSYDPEGSQKNFKASTRSPVFVLCLGDVK